MSEHRATKVDDHVIVPDGSVILRDRHFDGPPRRPNVFEAPA